MTTGCVNPETLTERENGSQKGTRNTGLWVKALKEKNPQSESSQRLSDMLWFV